MKMNRKRPWMGKLLSVVLALMIGFSAWNITPAYTLEVQAAEESQEVDLTEMFSSVKGQIKEALDKIDHETAVSMFDFVEEKIADGSLKTEEGVAAAMREGEERFGVNIDEATAKQVVDTMEKLEGMGFSAEELVGKAKGLYEKYGSNFVDHANELVTEAVEDAVATAVSSFFSNLWEETKSFFRNLVSGF